MSYFLQHCHFKQAIFSKVPTVIHTVTNNGHYCAGHLIFMQEYTSQKQVEDIFHNIRNIRKKDGEAGKDMRSKVKTKCIQCQHE